MSVGVRSDPEVLLAAARAGDQGALARLISAIERGGSGARAVARLATGTSPPYTLGLTGAPGAGKSTITNELITEVRRGWPRDGAGREPVDAIAVLAVDPSSPFSGGAILGDRVRMQAHATDPSVFIRSMATRGHLGGLTLAVPDALRLLGAAGLPVAIIETVGVGQMEVEVAGSADTTAVVVTPGWGDAMQANKAGLLEIADIFVINKADRPGVHQARHDLEQMLDLTVASDWRPPIVETTGSTGEGVEVLWGEVARHRAHLESSGRLEVVRAARLSRELRRIISARVAAGVEDLAGGEDFAAALLGVQQGTLDPYDAADRLLTAAWPQMVAETP